MSSINERAERLSQYLDSLSVDELIEQLARYWSASEVEDFLDSEGYLIDEKYDDDGENDNLGHIEDEDAEYGDPHRPEHAVIEGE